jgi:hypothetical protein
MRDAGNIISIAEEDAMDHPTAAELRLHFIEKADDHWGPDEEGWSICTNWAEKIQKALGKDRVVIAGFLTENNPSAKRMDYLAGGHDFAVVDGRWIVDPWITEVECEDKRGVYDLEQPFDDFMISIYGDPTMWVSTFADTAQSPLPAICQPDPVAAPGMG